MPQIAALFSNAKEYAPMEGRLIGKLPEWLEGAFIRNGPGIFDLDDGNFTVNHFLDGFAMICKFEFKHGRVFFQQKIIETEAYKKALLAKRNVYAEFGSRANPDPTKGIISKVITKLVPMDLTDNTVGNSYIIDGEFFAAYESCFINSIDPDSLVKKERFDFMASLGTISMSSHPLTDSEGVTWNVGSSMLSGCKYHIVRIPSARNGKAIEALKNAKIFATISSAWKTCVSYFHSFAMTKNYIIFMEQPMLINCVKLAQMGIKGKSLRDAFEWTPSEKNRFYIIEKSSGTVLKTKYRSEKAFFCFHMINAHEVDENIVIDMITYPSPLVLDKFDLSSLRNNTFVYDDPAEMNRYVLPIATDYRKLSENENLVEINGVTATARRAKDGIILAPQRIAPAGFEFPRINPRHQSKAYQYVYGTGTYDEGPFKNSICKVDVNSGKVLKHQAENANEFFGEPLFVPHPKRKDEEDDGVIISTVSCSDPAKPDYLAILDAASFTEIARAEYDAKFLQTFHGTFISKSSLSSTHHNHHINGYCC